MHVNQDVALLAGRLPAGGAATHRFAPGRRGWLHLARGAATANGVAFSAGDGAGIEGLDTLELATDTGAEVLVFDLGG